jgi:enamine deaminase RidA (YjgF/YER057c/UK114 family)
VTMIERLNPESVHRHPAFSQAVKVPAGADTIYVGGQNGVGQDGELVGPGIAEQTRKAYANLEACLDAAGAELTDVVKWTVLLVEIEAVAAVARHAADGAVGASG